MNRNTLILVVVLVVLAAIGLSVWNRKAAEAPVAPTSTTTAAPSDSPDAIERDLEGIDTGARMDADLDATDKDIRQL